MARFNSNRNLDAKILIKALLNTLNFQSKPRFRRTNFYQSYALEAQLSIKQRFRLSTFNQSYALDAKLSIKATL